MLSSSRKSSRDKLIKLRVTDEELALINHAALLLNKARTDFVITQAVNEAQNIILDQRVFVLDEARYHMFMEQLEAPVQNIEERTRLMEVIPKWE